MFNVVVVDAGREVEAEVVVVGFSSVVVVASRVVVVVGIAEVVEVSCGVAFGLKNEYARAATTSMKATPAVKQTALDCFLSCPVFNERRLIGIIHITQIINNTT